MRYEADVEKMKPAGAAVLGADPEEVLVSDVRGEMTPAEMVEQKLFALLWGRSAATSISPALNSERFRRLQT